MKNMEVFDICIASGSFEDYILSPKYHMILRSVLHSFLWAFACIAEIVMICSLKHKIQDIVIIFKALVLSVSVFAVSAALTAREIIISFKKNKKEEERKMHN